MIVCETLTLPIQGTSDSGNSFTVHHCLYELEKSKLVKCFRYTYSLTVSLYCNEYMALSLAKMVIFY